MLKSRSSDCFTSQLKDFIAPIPVSTATTAGRSRSRRRTSTLLTARAISRSRASTFTYRWHHGHGSHRRQRCRLLRRPRSERAVSASSSRCPLATSPTTTTKEVTPDNSASCSDASYGGETPSFHNTPLTDVVIKVTLRSRAVLERRGLHNGTDLRQHDRGNVDETETASNLEPRTITCTIIDRSLTITVPTRTTRARHQPGPRVS